MDIYSDAADPVCLKPAKLKTIRLNRRPGVPYFGFGVSNNHVLHLNETIATSLFSIDTWKEAKFIIKFKIHSRYVAAANMDWDSLLPKLYLVVKASCKD
jgi:hypothetical protein